MTLYVKIPFKITWPWRTRSLVKATVLAYVALSFLTRKTREIKKVIDLACLQPEIRIVLLASWRHIVKSRRAYVTSRHVNIFEFSTIIGCQDKFSINAKNFSLEASPALKWHTKNQLGHTCTLGYTCSLYPRYASPLFFKVCLWRLMTTFINQRTLAHKWNGSLDRRPLKANYWLQLTEAEPHKFKLRFSFDNWTQKAIRANCIRRFFAANGICLSSPSERFLVVIHRLPNDIVPVKIYFGLSPGIADAIFSLKHFQSWHIHHVMQYSYNCKSWFSLSLYGSLGDEWNKYYIFWCSGVASPKKFGTEQFLLAGEQ